MFYTKYRPQKFSEIAKPNEVAEALVTQIVAGKTVHAYLFVGPRGTGKTSTARILAKALNCQHLSKDGDPCGECDVCMGITEGSFIDLHEIDAASNRGIDDIRDLKDKIKLAPAVGKNKVYIIDEVHMLTTEAFNALLKTLEEPPRNTVFILCTTELHKVPETIKSRCQLFKFKRATIAQLTDKLSSITKNEKAKISTEDIQKIARASVGGYRDAETLLQQVIEGEIKVDVLISANAKHSVTDFINLLLSKKVKESLEIVNSLYDDGIDLYYWVGEVLRFLRASLLIKSGFNKENGDFPPELLEEISLVDKLTLPWLLLCIEKFSTAHGQIKTSYIPQLPVEVAVLSILGFDGPVVTEDPKPKKNPETPIKPVSKPEKKVEVEPKPVEETSPESNETSFYEETTVVITPEAVAFDDVSSKWDEILNNVKSRNSTVQALLKSAKPISINGKFVMLEVYFAFHKERLETHKNRDYIEKALLEIFGVPLSIKCELSTSKPKHLSDREVGVLTDYNVVVPGGESFDRDKVLTMLDGGLPL